MDYEKAYKDLMRDIDIAIEGQREGETKIVLQNLKERNTESEDEKIRKWIINEIQYQYDIKNFPDAERAISWLEKQKEQKLMQTAREKQYVVTLDRLIDEYLDSHSDLDKGYYDHIREWLDGRTIEHKPLTSKEIDACIYPSSQEWDCQMAYSEGYRKGMESVKPAEWSDEDKHRLEQAINALGRNGYYVLVDWLKLLPEKFNTQPKQEWSEEDERHILVISEQLEAYQSDKTLRNPLQKHIDWLKSLRPNQWKPSEDLLEALDDAIHLDKTIIRKDRLRILYEQLKQL